MADKVYYETFTSPAGIAVFPWITKADTEHDAAGVFHTDLSVPPDMDVVQEFVAKLEKVRDEFAKTLPVAKQQALNAKPVFKDEYTFPTFPEGASDAEKAKIKHEFVPELTGNILFRFKLKQNVMPASGAAFSQAPVVVMADTGEKCEDPVYKGSVIRVRGQIVPYSNDSAGQYGVTLRMKAVQVIELVTGGSGASAHWTDFDGASD